MSEFDLPPEPAPVGPMLRLVRDQRLAFVIVGVVNTIVGFSLFVVCSESVGHVVDQRFGRLAGTLTTIGISHVFSVLFAFVMHRRFVFRVRGHVVRDLMRFESVYLTALCINAVALPLLVELGMHRIPAQAIIILSTTLLSWFGHRHFTFRRSGSDTQDESSRTSKRAGLTPPRRP